jgi:hypothetical protein
MYRYLMNLVDPTVTVHGGRTVAKISFWRRLLGRGA